MSERRKRRFVDRALHYSRNSVTDPLVLFPGLALFVIGLAILYSDLPLVVALVPLLLHVANYILRGELSYRRSRGTRDSVRLANE
jgi:hypothetical protein